MNKQLFIVVMDKPGATDGRMPRTFYRKVNMLAAVTRIQQSVYLVTGVLSTKALATLGRNNGFQVRCFRVEEELTW